MFAPLPLPRTFPAAERDVADKKESVRRSAVADLALFVDSPQHDSARHLLHERLARDDSPRVRAAAAQALADVGDASSVPLLVEAALSSWPQVQQMALLALTQRAAAGDADAIRAASEALASEVPQVRYQALIALEALDERVEAALARAFGDADPQIRYLAVRLAEQRLFPEREAFTPSFMGRVVRLAENDPAPEVELCAALLLARRKHERGEELLASCFNRKNRKFELDDEFTAIELIGKRRLRAALPGLKARQGSVWVLWPDPLVWAARTALAELGDEKAKHQILRALDAWTLDQRNFAVVAAGRAGMMEAKPRLSSMRGNERRAEPDAVEEALRQLDASSNCSGAC